MQQRWLGAASVLNELLRVYADDECGGEYRCSTWTWFATWRVSCAVSSQAPATAPVSSRGSCVTARNISRCSGHTRKSACAPQPINRCQPPPPPSRRPQPMVSGVLPSSTVRGRGHGPSPSPSRSSAVHHDASSPSSNVIISGNYSSIIPRIRL